MLIIYCEWSFNVWCSQVIVSQHDEMFRSSKQLHLFLTCDNGNVLWVSLQSKYVVSVTVSKVYGHRLWAQTNNKLSYCKAIMWLLCNIEISVRFKIRLRVWGPHQHLQKHKLQNHKNTCKTCENCNPAFMQSKMILLKRYRNSQNVFVVINAFHLS